MSKDIPKEITLPSTPTDSNRDDNSLLSKLEIRHPTKTMATSTIG